MILDEKPGLENFSRMHNSGLRPPPGAMAETTAYFATRPGVRLMPLEDPGVRLVPLEEYSICITYGIIQHHFSRRQQLINAKRGFCFCEA